MSTIPLPALAVQAPPQGEQPLDMFARIAQIKGMQQNQQLQGAALQTRQLQNLQLQMESQDDQKWRTALADPNWDGTPADLLKNGLKQGVGPKSYMMMQQGLTQLQQGQATLGKDQLAIQQTIENKIGDSLEAVTTAQPNQKQAVYTQAKQDLLSTIQNAPGLNPQIQKGWIQQFAQMPDTYPGDDWANNHVALNKLRSALTDEALKNAQTAEAAGKGVQAQAEAAKATADTANAQAQLPRYQAEAGVAPQLAQLDVQGRQASIAEAQARTAQTRMQTAQMANLPDGLKGVASHLIAPASAAAEKAGTEYLTAKEAADNLADFLDAARSGNKTAVKIVPLQGALEITTAQGVHRINRTEVDQYGGGGSAYDRLAGKIGGVLTGKSITDDVLNSMDALQQRISQNSRTLYQNKLDLANQTYNSHFTPTFGTPRTPSGPPPGATHIVRGPDGKNHYTNPAGTIDYGVAP